MFFLSVIKEKEYHEITTPSTNHLDAPNGLPMQILNARIKPNVSEVQRKIQYKKVILSFLLDIY
jgi:hypothetical protein